MSEKQIATIRRMQLAASLARLLLGEKIARSMPGTPVESLDFIGVFWNLPYQVHPL